MATAHSTATTPLSVDPPPKPEGRRQTATLVPGRLRPFLGSERDSLVKAQSLLECIAHSMEHAEHPVLGPYYPDVARLASDMIRQRIRNLDELLLDGRLPQSPRP
jgi:hypothetical protein